MYPATLPGSAADGDRAPSATHATYELKFKLNDTKNTDLYALV